MHICDPPAPYIYQDLFNTPLYPPVLFPQLTKQQYNKWTTWHKWDAIIYGVLTACLSHQILGMIPPQNDPFTGVHWTMREAFHTLCHCYRDGNLQQAMLEHRHLSTTVCTTYPQLCLAIDQSHTNSPRDLGISPLICHIKYRHGQHASSLLLRDI